jgi:hypothetical protein
MNNLREARVVLLALIQRKTFARSEMKSRAHLFTATMHGLAVFPLLTSVGDLKQTSPRGSHERVCVRRELEDCEAK